LPARFSQLVRPHGVRHEDPDRYPQRRNQRAYPTRPRAPPIAMRPGDFGKLLSILATCRFTAAMSTTEMPECWSGIWLLILILYARSAMLVPSRCKSRWPIPSIAAPE
jgi:hypothetical protein